MTLFAQRLSITPAPVTIVEGKSEDIMVVLSSQPTGDVTVTIVTRNGADVRLDRSELTFTPSNWNQPQKVTIMADQNADLSENNRALILIASGGGYVGNGVTVSPHIVLIQSPGETFQLKGVIKDQDDAHVTGVVLEWSSADSSIAVVNSTGEVTAVSPGITTIAATFATTEGTATIWVGYPSEFNAFTGLRIGNDGSITLQTGGITLSAGVTECLTGGETFNGNRFDYHWTAWQLDTGSGWTEVPGTKRADNKLCGYDLASATPGKYRLVGDMTLAGVRDNYKSENEVTGGNRPPAAVGSISARSVTVGDDVSVDDASPYFSDPDGDILTYTATSSNTGLATASVSGSTVTVNGVAEGSATITVTATDPGGLSATQSFDVTVDRANQSPVAVGSISDRLVNVGDNVSVNDVSPYFSDPDGDILTYTAASSNMGLATASVSGSTVTVNGVAEGSATITVTATDPGGLYATQSFDVTIRDGGGGNQSPVAVGSISDRSVNVGDNVSVNDVSPYFSDPDGDILTYTATSSNTGLATASVSGSAVTVNGVAEGSATITVTATDPGGLSATQSFDVTIQDGGGGNQSPMAVGSISARSVNVGDNVSVDDVSPYFSDPDGDILTYTARSSNTSLAMASVSGSTVTVTGVAEGSATITVTATDPGGLSATQSFDVTVDRANQSPMAVGSISDRSVNVGDNVSVDDVSPYFSDPDGDILTYTARSSNTGLAMASVSVSTVTVTGVAEGSATITVTATDPGGLSATQSFDVTVDDNVTFKPFTGLSIRNDGSIFLQVGFVFLGVGPSNCMIGGGSINGRVFDYHWSAWQRDTGSGWTEVSGSRNTGKLCGYDLASAGSGTYRLVGDMTLAGVRDHYKSENEVTVSGGNQLPVAVGSISARLVNVGDDISVDDVSPYLYFGHPDGDILTYTATSSNTDLATASVSGSTVTVTGVAEGSATITVTATGPGSLSATQSFDVTIQDGGGGN